MSLLLFPVDILSAGQCDPAVQDADPPTRLTPVQTGGGWHSQHQSRGITIRKVDQEVPSFYIRVFCRFGGNLDELSLWENLLEFEFFLY